MKQVHHAGAFYVVEIVLSDSSKVYDIYFHAANDPAPTLIHNALDEQDAIKRTDALAAALV